MQRSVTTRTRDIESKKKKIAGYMVLHPEGCTPKMIASATSINVNSVKSILPRLQNIEKVARGWYKVANGGDTPLSSSGTLQSWNFHNLVLSTQLNHFKPHDNIVKFNLVKLHIHISKTGYCTLRLSTDYPMNVSSICILFGYMCHYLKDYTSDVLTMDKIMVRTVEFNKDHANLKLDGVNCITLDNLATQFKLYQKKRGLRQEHKTKVQFNTANMVDMLTGSATAIDISQRMTDTTNKLNKLTGQAIYNTALLNKLLEVQQHGAKTRN